LDVAVAVAADVAVAAADVAAVLLLLPPSI